MRYGWILRILDTVADMPVHAKAGLGRIKIGIVVGVVVLVVVAAVAYMVSRPSSSNANSATGPGSPSKSPATTAASLGLAVLPADGASGVMPDTTISVTASMGHLLSVVVTGTNGDSVNGSIGASGTTWQSSGTLALKTDYTVTVDGTTSSGAVVEQSTHFASLVPTATLGYTVTPSSGLTVGVGEPIVLRFDHPVAAANQAALIAQLQVAESNPVPGGWRWFDDHELHFRPETYWPTGDQVAFTAHLAGFDAGNGIWATSNASTTFTIGDSHVATANVTTHEMTVTNNGKVIATYPISTGRDIYPTMDGVHIDLYRSQVVHMVSSTVGIPVNSPNGYDELVYWDVNISDGGEFVHAAPWDIADQGHENVSHGCINVAPANAESFFNFSRIGDVIDVVGSPRPPNLGDHGTMDWNTPWADWTPAAVIQLPGTTPPPPTTSTTTVAPPVTAAATTTIAPAAATTTTVAPTTTTAATTTTTAPLYP